MATPKLPDPVFVYSENIFDVRVTFYYYETKIYICNKSLLLASNSAIFMTLNREFNKKRGEIRMILSRLYRIMQI